MIQASLVRPIADMYAILGTVVWDPLYFQYVAAMTIL